MNVMSTGKTCDSQRHVTAYHQVELQTETQPTVEGPTKHRV